MTSSSPKHDSLAYSLLGAARAVALVRTGTALPQALARVNQTLQASPQARGAIQDIAYRAMRARGRADALVQAMTSKPPQPALLLALLECALALLDTDADADAAYEAYTVVDQTVSAAGAEAELAHARGMVNAVLRRFLRERNALAAQLAGSREAQWNYPQWWIDAARTAYPADWEQLLAAGNCLPPLTLRVNRRKTDMTAYLALLEQHAMAAQQLGPDAVRLTQPVPVQRIPGFEQGLVSVQDAAAQLAAPLLDAQDGMRVLDACAAPGGKTGHLLECAALDLLALDQDGQRLQRVADNLARLQLQASLQQGDAARQDWWDGKPFDRILADVPCTASGIVRRHPDIRWLRRKGDAAQLATLSARILDNLWQMLAPGGKMLFVTCSVWPQESEGQAAAFAVRHQALRLAAPGQMLPISQAGQDHDGLFYALFQKPGL
ncbi:16S rRNA (cytosine(967)-C(5))-methyltransferase RsmB|uniref:16S rRNA (cytosine(967)-C(5))-methyltransferase RsmB n=1 Tax=Noviherbaspirillum sp. L7-7A TaxID=2850560 RepID=UPI001C2BEDF0|nr:16S rRNA (cytosine(967)-C(5))-methyltransferase RsmB [Noviherbaspirillum sp. L7-7A]